MAGPGIHEPVTPGVRTVDTPQRVNGAVRESNVPPPSVQNMNVAEGLRQTIGEILRTGISTAGEVIKETVPAYFAYQSARDASGHPMNSSPQLQRANPSAEEIADAVQRRASLVPLASAFKSSDNVIKMSLIIGGVVLAIVSLAGRK